MKKDLVTLFNQKTERMPFNPENEQAGSLAFDENEAIRKKVVNFFTRWMQGSYVRCIKCRKNFRREEGEGRPVCPHCGTIYRNPIKGGAI